MRPHQHPHPTRLRGGHAAGAAISLATLAALSLAACGKDTKAASTVSPTAASATPVSSAETSPSGPPPSSAAAGGTAAACMPFLAIDDEMNKQQPDPAVLTPLFDQLSSAAPAELTEPVGVMVDAAKKMVASNGQDSSAFQTSAFVAAQTKVDTWMFDQCSFDAKVKVTTKDFEFDGLPATMKPGKTAFLVTNAGPESHELDVARKKTGTTDSWQDLVKLPQEQAATKVDQLGGGFVPAVGSSALVVVELTPGDYAALCFIPMGSSMTATGTVTEGSGAPHAMSGMVKEFTVAP